MNIEEMIENYERHIVWAETEINNNGYRYTPGYLQSQVDTLRSVVSDLKFLLNRSKGE